MTVTVTNAYSGPYVANGVTTVFPFTFAAADDASVKVLGDGVEITTGFTVAVTEGGGGSVTFAVAPASGTEILIESDPAFVQDVAFTDSGPFLASSVDEVADEGAIRDIYLKDKVARAILVERGEAVPTYDDIVALINAVSSPTASGADAVNVFDYMTTAERADVSARTLTLNVTNALHAASQALEAQDGGTLFLPPGDYLVGLNTLGGTTLDGGTVIAWGPEEIITIKNCTRTIRISGYGARLVSANGLHYGSFDPITGARFDPPPGGFVDFAYYGYPYRGQINLEGNNGYIIEGLELDGNSANMVIGGYFGDSYYQVEGHGIWNRNNGTGVLIDVYSHDHPGDGITTAQTGVTDATPAQPLTLLNCRFTYNGRQGHSITGGKCVTHIGCDLSFTGQRVNIGTGLKHQSTPGCGVDVEAEATLIRNVTFIGCTMVGNWRRGIIGASGNSKGITFKNCTIENAIVGRFRYIFENCLFVGYTNFATPLTNEYEPYSNALTLTIAGAGPYTLTRSAGSFITDGFKVGDMVMLPTVFLGGGGYNPGINANNINKRLQITVLTATVMTVGVVDGGTLTAEGPITPALIATATNEDDGLRFHRCRFEYDDALSGLGVMVDSVQSAWEEANWGQWHDCVMNMRAQELPSAFASPLKPHSMVWDNCTWNSANTSVNHGITGYFRGMNKITLTGAGAVFTGAFGTASRIDYGRVTVNGVAQGVPDYTLTNVTEDRVLDADAAVVTETNDVLATLVNDFIAAGLAK